MAEIERKNILFTDYDMIRNDFRSVLSACIGGALVIKRAASKVIYADWEIDFSQASVYFSSKRYPIQFIGSVAKSDNSWNWGWNNINEFREDILDLARKTFNVAKLWGLQELSSPVIRCDELCTPANLSIVAIALSQRNYTYLAAEHGNGAAFIAVANLPDEVFDPVDAQDFARIIKIAIDGANLNHKLLLDGFAAWNGSAIEWVEPHVAVVHADRDIRFELDERMQIANIEVQS